jgi:TRAP-type transport system small permease protein
LNAVVRLASVVSTSLQKTLGIVCAVILFAMMLVTFADVVLRYFFSAPLGGAFEISEILLAVLVFSALPLVSLRGSHITTDLIDRFLSPRVARAATGAIEVLWIAGLAGVSRLVWIRAGRLADDNAITPVLQFPLGVLAYAIAMLLAAGALAHALRLAGARMPDAQAAGGAL